MATWLHSSAHRTLGSKIQFLIFSLIIKTPSNWLTLEIKVEHHLFVGLDPNPSIPLPFLLFCPLATPPSNYSRPPSYAVQWSMPTQPQSWILKLWHIQNSDKSSDCIDVMTKMQTKWPHPWVRSQRSKVVDLIVPISPFPFLLMVISKGIDLVEVMSM